MIARKFCGAALAILQMGLIPTCAQPTPPPQFLSAALSLNEARRIAFERNWDLLAARSGLDAAAAQSLVAGEFPNPTLSFSTARIGSSQSGTPAGNGLWQRNYDTIIAVSQLVEIGGKRHDRQASARAGIVGARARFEEARRLLEQGVTKAFVAALLANEKAEVLNESARLLRHEVEIAQARLKAGDLSDSDEKQIENNADGFELQAQSAAAAAVQARIAVEILLGSDQPRGLWTPAETLAQMVITTPESHAANTSALRPDVRATEADWHQAQADLKLQRAMRIPDPTVSLLGEHNPPGGGPATDTFGLGISFPLPLWNWNRGEIKTAQAKVEQSALALAKARAQATADAANADVEYREAIERLQRYQNQILPKSQQVRESVAFAYEKGGATLVDLLEAERADSDARLATAQALADTASAVADLKAARETTRNPNRHP